MATHISLTSQGVQKVLKNYEDKPNQSVVEYIWNGFDAKATCIEIVYEVDTKWGRLSKLEIRDNGHGIPRNELERKFKNFYESEKSRKGNTHKNTSALHGKNGIGRLSFFSFASHACWTTVYQDGDKLKTYSITITGDKLQHYETSSLKDSDAKTTGTCVTFTGLKGL